MYEELVKRLRRYVEIERSEHHGAELEAEAADAIEKLIEFIQNHDFLESLIKPHWIPVMEMLPEESEGLDWREEMTIKGTSVWCCDVNTGTINVRNRFQHKITGIQFLDQNIQDTDWHWSKSWWEPTHWMPIVPLPQPPKEEE